MPKVIIPQTDQLLIGRQGVAQRRTAAAASLVVPGEDSWLAVARQNPNANIVAASSDPRYSQASVAVLPYPLGFMQLALVQVNRSTPAAKIYVASNGSIAYTATGYNGVVLYRYDAAGSQLVLLDQSVNSAGPIRNSTIATLLNGYTIGRGLYAFGFCCNTTAFITAGAFIGINATNLIPDSVMSSALNSSSGLLYPFYVPSGSSTFSTPPATVAYNTLTSAGALGIGVPWMGLYSA